MSHNFTLVLQMQDIECLRKALMDLRVPETAIYTGENLKIRGWNGKETAGMQLVVMKQAVGNTYDFGFSQGLDGNYSLNHETMDRTVADKTFQGQLMQAYNQQWVTKKLTNEGWTKISTGGEGRTRRLVFEKW